MRADFDYWANFVAIDIVGDDYSVDTGVLYAYDSGGVLLESVASGGLRYGEVFTATINRPSFDIAYIIAGGTAGDAVHLDNLIANVIPEPTTLLLLGFGGLILIRKRQ